MTTAPHPRAVRGFTVVEVLAALSIFAFAAVMMASAYLNVLNSYEAAARGAVVDEDFAFARQQVLREPDPRRLEEGGEFETAGGRRAKWSAEIAPTTIADVYRSPSAASSPRPMLPVPSAGASRFSCCARLG